MGKNINLADLADEDFLDPEETSSPSTAVAVLPTAGAAVADAQPDHADGWMVVSVDSVALNPLNKRYPGEDDEIEGMAETIKGRTKVIQPLVVCTADAFLAEFPDQAATIGTAAWVVLIGNRRLLAVRRAAVDDLVQVIVNDELAESMYMAMLIENGHHRNLPPLLEAEAMAESIAKHGFSQRELARQIGKSHPYVIQRLALLKLIPALKAAFERGELKIELARQMGELSAPEQERIVAAGKPYRLLGGNGVTTRAPNQRTIRASTPAIAAASIRQRFSPVELTELIRLLTEEIDGAGERRGGSSDDTDR
jgi:ParB family chromosome partitioning protein